MMVNTYEGLLVLLVRSEVRFTLVGGLAVCLNGFVRTTEDVDILVEGSSPNLRRLLDCLLQFGEGYARELSIADFTAEEGAIRVREEFDLDIFVQIRGQKFGDLAQHVVAHRLQDGTRVPFLNAQGLILLKRNSTREKDRIDTDALLRLLEEAKGEAFALPLDAVRPATD